MAIPIKVERRDIVRLKREQLDALKKKFGVDRIWSFSRLNIAHQCLPEYFHTYILHDIPRSGNVYTEFGTYSHNLIQELIQQRITYSVMGKKWDELVQNWEKNPNAYQFDSDKIKNGYVNNLRHYFNHTQVPSGSNFEIEKPVLAKIGKRENGKPKYVFVGYVDTQYIDEDGNTVLVDYKTSSKSSFSKAKLPEKSRQLMLYAIAKHQHNNIPYDKIRCLFDMMKYVRVHYKQENGKWDTSVQERARWVSKMEKKLLTKLKKNDFSEAEAEEMVQVASLSNSLDNMPADIQEQFFLENYVIDIPVDQERCEQLAKEIEDDCDSLVEFEDMTREQQESYLEANCPYNPDNYYDKKLCAWHTSQKFKDKEKALDDILEPQLVDITDDQFINQLFSEGTVAEELFS